MIVIAALVLGFWVLAALLLALAFGRAAAREMPAPGAPGSVAVIRTERPTAGAAVSGGRPLAG